MPWRQLGVLALIALLLAAAIVGYVASQQTRLPAPFGPARNGQVVYADKGDIDDVHVRVAVVPADGSSHGTEIPYEGIINAACCAAWEWAPDDSKIIGTPIGSSGEPLHQVIVDPVAGAIATAPWPTTSDPSWQRVAR